MRYPCDLTNAQWEAIRPLLEYSNGYGNPSKHPLRIMIIDHYESITTLHCNIA